MRAYETNEHNESMLHTAVSNTFYMEENIILAFPTFQHLYEISQSDYRDVYKKAAAWEPIGSREKLSGKFSPHEVVS